MRTKKSTLIPLHLRVSKSARSSSRHGQWATISFFSLRDVTLTATKPSDRRRVTLSATSASDRRIQIQTYIQRKRFLCVIRTTVARHKQRTRRSTDRVPVPVDSKACSTRVCICATLTDVWQNHHFGCYSVLSLMTVRIYDFCAADSSRCLVRSTLRKDALPLQT